MYIHKEYDQWPINKLTKRVWKIFVSFQCIPTIYILFVMGGMKSRFEFNLMWFFVCMYIHKCHSIT